MLIASRHARRTNDMDSDFIEDQLQQAADLLDAGKPAEALRCLEAIQDELLESEERIECASLSGWALSGLGRADEAVALLQPLLEQFPESSRLFGTLGVVLSDAERLEEACDVLEKAIELDHTDGVLLANLGYVHEKLHDCVAATKLYDRSLQNGADVGWVLRRLATVQCDMDEHAAARASLRRYLSLCPEDSAEWISLAIVYSELGEYDDSFECYRRAESLGADDVSLHFNWGLTAERAGRVEDARARLRRLTAVASDSPQVAVLRGFILEHEGDLEAAFASHLEAIVRAGGEHIEERVYAYETAMDFCAEHKMRDEAEALFRRAYADDACSVELCEAHRELTGESLDRAYWFSLMMDKRGRRRGPRSKTRSTARRFQVVARDRDHAIAMVHEFVQRMGDTKVSVSEFVNEEPMEDTFTGIYEVEPRLKRRTHDKSP